MIHYDESRWQKRYRLKSSADYYGGAICGNGDASVSSTKILDSVTCAECISIISITGVRRHPPSKELI